MKILVTGANGFVGSHIVEELVKEGHDVTCMVRKTSSLKWLTGCKAGFVTCDLSAVEDFSEVLKDCDAVVHTAGILRAKETDKYYEVNQLATKKLAEAVLKHNPPIKRFVYISSLAAQGPAGNSVCSNPEPGAEKPVSDYGKSKLAGERELKILEGKIPCVILRPAAVYGPRDKDIFIFFKLVSMGLRIRPVNERFFQLVYVRDIARAVVSALTCPAGFNIYQLAEKTVYSWEDVGKIIAFSVGKKTVPLPLPDIVFMAAAICSEFASIFTGKPAVLNRQKIDELLMPFWVCDMSKSEKDLRMDFTKLNFGGKITYNWYKSNNWF